MASIGSLVLDLALQSQQFLAGIRNANAATSNFARLTSLAMSNAKAAFAGFGAGLGAMFSLDAIQSQIQSAFDYGDAIVDLSDRTGVATSTIQQFRYAAQLSGSSVESADLALEKFTKNLGGAINGNKAMATSFNALGVSAKDPDAALRQFMDGVAKLPSIAQRQAAATQMMGKGAADLTALLSGGTNGFNELALAAQQYGLVIDDDVLRNGGKVNDQLDTMKMIVNAQMASAIIHNADALMAFANAAIEAGAAAADFFAKMKVNDLMSTQQNNPLKVSVPRYISGRMQGKSWQQIQEDDRAELKTTKAGREALHADLTRRYNEAIRAGRNKNDPDMQAMLAERADIAKREALSRRPVIVAKPPVAVPGTFHPAATQHKPSKGGSHGGTERTDDQIKANWDKDLARATDGLLGSLSSLSIDPTQRADYEAQRLKADSLARVAAIGADTGTDAQIREGKKKYTQAQAVQLQQIERETYEAELSKVTRDRDAEIARQALSVREAGLHNTMDELQSEQALARSSSQHRDIALRMVDKQFELERLQLDAVLASKEATAAEKQIAEARLKILDKLQAGAREDATQQTQSPLDTYLDQIPKTTAELNDAFEKVQVDGLQKLEDGMLGVIEGTKSVGEAFSDMTKGILADLLKIAIQQTIIKPIGAALFGGSDAGGGGIFGSLLSGLTGKRANGGMTQPGNYLVGERGQEVVSIGAPANVIPHGALRNAQAGGAGGININFGSIVSNDPEAIRRVATEAVMQSMPLVAEQAKDRTLGALRRRQM